MPDLSKYPVPQYEAGQPYHWSYDNIPINGLVRRDEVINDEVEKHATILISAAGTVGTLAARISQSLNEDGNLKNTAIDESLHNIAEHIDSEKIETQDSLNYYNDTLGYNVSNPVNFVRMLEAERTKLALIASEAKNIIFQIETINETIEIDSGIIKFALSNYIQWDVTPGSPLVVKPIAVNPRYYDLTPVSVNLSTPDYINYKATLNSAPFVDGSLRIYINGIRITTDVEIYVAEEQHKPIFFVCEGGLTNFPNWLFALIKFDLNDKPINIFENIEDVVKMLIKLNNGIEEMGDEWVLVRKFIEKNRPDWT